MPGTILYSDREQDPLTSVRAAARQASKELVRSPVACLVSSSRPEDLSIAHLISIGADLKGGALDVCDKILLQNGVVSLVRLGFKVDANFDLTIYNKADSPDQDVLNPDLSLSTHAIFLHSIPKNGSSTLGLWDRDFDLSPHHNKKGAWDNMIRSSGAKCAMAYGSCHGTEILAHDLSALKSDYIEVVDPIFPKNPWLIQKNFIANSQH